MGHDLITALTVTGFVVIAIVVIAWHVQRGRTLLDRWAAQHRYRILSAEYRNFARGPFFWTSREEQAVYRVTVEDTSGRVRSGWVRCGSWMLGVWSSQVKVRWDDEG